MSTSLTRESAMMTVAANRSFRDAQNVVTFSLKGILVMHHFQLDWPSNLDPYSIQHANSKCKLTKV